MIEDMTCAGSKINPRGYIRIVSAFCRVSGQITRDRDPEDVRAYQIHLSQAGVPTRHQRPDAALRFLFTMTLDRPDLSRRLCGCFNRAVASVLALMKWRALAQQHAEAPCYLSVAYGAGLRAGEVEPQGWPY
jgi:integrase/recombinase XerD